MKIALVAAERLPIPPIRGGAVEIYIHEVAKRLKGLGDFITVIGPQDKELADSETFAHVRHIRLPARTQSEYLVEIWLHFLKQDYDIIHIFNRPQFVSPIRRILPKAKIILNLHNDHLVREMSREAAQACIEDTDYIITNSHYTRKNVVLAFPSSYDKCRTVHLGVDTIDYFPHWHQLGRRMALREKYGLTERSVILFVGRLNKNKGVHLLLEALRELRTREPGLALVIVGSPWFGMNSPSEYSLSLEEMAKGLEPDIIFTGFVPPAKMPEMFLLGDVFTAPSVWSEPFGRVNIEAMACGLPVVSTKRGGIPEAVVDGETGVLIEETKDARGLVQALEVILKNPSLARKMGEMGRARVEEKFNWERVTKELKTIYREVLG